VIHCQHVGRLLDNVAYQTQAELQLLIVILTTEHLLVADLTNLLLCQLSDLGLDERHVSL
jgi:hypothetical protein